jgi:predicted MFS family arabinose efflux permease
MTSIPRAAPPDTTRRRAPLYALYTANIISAVGDVLMFLAVPWFVLQTTGSIARTGVTAFFSTAAVAASALLGGGLVDHIGFRRASILSDLASAVGVALIPLFYALGMLPFWALLALVFVAGVLTTPGATARSALVPDLAHLAGARLERVSAMTDGLSRVSRFIGAPLAGVLIVVIGTSNLLWLDAASFAASAALIGLAVPRLAAARPAEGEATGAKGIHGYLANLGMGIRFIWRDPLMLSIIAVIMVTNLLDAGYSEVLVPADVRQVFGSPVVLGALVAALGGAGFVGTLIFGAVGHRLPRRLTLGIGYTIGGAPRFFALALVPIVPVLVVVHAVSGLGISPVNPLFDTIAYERVPAETRARVFGAITAGAWIGSPLGGLLAGVLATWAGLPATLLGFGAVYLLATVSLLVNPALRGMDRKREAGVGAG